jgi:hypothetical protein
MIFALRDDLGKPTTSEPYVLMNYKEQPAGKLWRFRVFKVVREEAPYFFRDWEGVSREDTSEADPYEGEAGQSIEGPFPLRTLLPYCEETDAVSGPVFEDRTKRHWVKAAGNDGGSAKITMRYFYPNQIGFFPDSAHGGPKSGQHIPWLDDDTKRPVDVTYTVKWPDDAPKMKIGQTLIEAMNGLPGISGQCSVDLLYQQSDAIVGGSSVMLIDPIITHGVTLARIPNEVKTEDQGAEKSFPDLSLALRLRVSYDPINFRLKFKGISIKPVTGFQYALLNVMSKRERDELQALSKEAGWQAAINALYEAASKPVVIKDSNAQPYDKLALTSGLAQGVGFVTLALQNNSDTTKCGSSDAVSLMVIKVIPELDPGAIMVITPPCPFDEMLTLRHRGDFGGAIDEYQFEWRYLPDEDGTQPSAPKDQWLVFTPKPASGEGGVDINIKGPGILTLSDNWFVCRYKTPNGNMPWSGRWSEWTPAQLGEGWIKRVVGNINPFTQRASGGGIAGTEDNFFSYANKEVNTVVSMISQAGPKWTGDVPMNCKNLDDFGLLQIYETVLGRGIDFSIDGLPPVNYPPANSALLLVASRIADLYMLLGNEAYADAADPTIAFGTDDGQYGAEASSIHCFMNMKQIPSLLDEELALLRGRDDSAGPGVKVHPFYNRLIWNFTKDLNGGEAAYALNYNIQDQLGNVDGTISEADAKPLSAGGMVMLGDII